jgi:distribution and morphology protein 32
MAIRSKWFLIKGYRPFNIDEIIAFFSWIVLSHLLWIILGTTTFFSLLFYGLNSIFAKELVGNLTGKFITWLTPGLDIVFEEAIVPEWKQGMIDFKKVIVKTAHNEYGNNGIRLDLKFESIKLTLSFKKWKDLKGLVENVEVLGMTGLIDKSGLSDDDELKIYEYLQNEDYELENFKIQDSNVKVIQGEDTKPLNISIYNCELPRLRLKWIFLDFWNVGSMNGSINDSLFAIHKRQHKLAYVNDVEDDSNPWKRISRFRLDQINIEDVGLTGSQFNWLVDGGKVEITADIMPPVEEKDVPYDLRYVVIDLKIQFSDLKAKIPQELPMLSNGEPIISMDQLKPIINYINTKRLEVNDHEEIGTLPPISFRVVKRLSDFEDVSTLKQSKLLDAIATEIYIDLTKHVHEFEIEQRYKKFETWSKTLASQLLVVGLGAMA